MRDRVRLRVRVRKIRIEMQWQKMKATPLPEAHLSGKRKRSSSEPMIAMVAREHKALLSESPSTRCGNLFRDGCASGQDIGKESVNPFIINQGSWAIASMYTGFEGRNHEERL